MGVEAHPNNKEKIAFFITGTFWQYVILFRLCNSPATFELLMETVLKNFIWKVCLTRSPSVRHLKSTYIICGLFFRNSRKLVSNSLCLIFIKKVRYLGYIVSVYGLRVSIAEPRCKFTISDTCSNVLQQIFLMLPYSVMLFMHKIH